MKWVHLSFFISLMVLISLGQLQRFSVGPFAAVYLHDLVLVAWSGLLLGRNWEVVSKKASLQLSSALKNKVVLGLVAVICLGWLGAALTNNFTPWTGLFIARLAVYFGWGWLVYSTKVISKEWWQLGFLAAGLAIAIFGLLQYVLLPDTRFLSILGWDDHYYRLISTQLDPNFTGLILAITLFWWWETPFAWWQWLVHGLSTTELKKLQRGTNLVVSILLLVAITLTFSRSSWISLVVGGLFLLKPKVNLKLILAGCFLAVITLVLAPKPTGEGINILRTSSIAARLTYSAHWLQSLTSYQLVIGRGLFVPPAKELSVATGIAADHANLPDNVLVLLISGVGVVGTVMVFYLIYSTKHFTQLNSLTGAVLVATITHSLFNNSLLQVFVLIFILGTIIRQQKIKV